MFALGMIYIKFSYFQKCFLLQSDQWEEIRGVCDFYMFSLTRYCVRNTERLGFGTCDSLNVRHPCSFVTRANGDRTISARGNAAQQRRTISNPFFNYARYLPVAFLDGCKSFSKIPKVARACMCDRVLDKEAWADKKRR